MYLSSVYKCRINFLVWWLFTVFTFLQFMIVVSRFVPPGYQGDGVTCRYVGVCRVHNGGCHPLASCSESPGENNDTNV